MTGAPLAKDGRLESPTWLGFVRRLPCAFCDAPAPSAPHHYPQKRMGSANVDDSRTCPVCTPCHRRCEGEWVNGNPPIAHSDQNAAVLTTMASFIRHATAEEFAQFERDRRRWLEGRVFSAYALGASMVRP